EIDLKPHEGLTQQPRLTLQVADERVQVVIQDRAFDVLHDKRLPRSDLCRVRGSLLDEVLDEGRASHASIDACAEFGIERDTSIQQKGSHRLVREAAGAGEGFGDGLEMGLVPVERCANAVEIAKRREELECVRKNGFALKQLQQPPGAGLEEAL